MGKLNFLRISECGDGGFEFSIRLSLCSAAMEDMAACVIRCTAARFAYRTLLRNGLRDRSIENINFIVTGRVWR